MFGFGKKSKPGEPLSPMEQEQAKMLAQLGQYSELAQAIEGGLHAEVALHGEYLAECEAARLRLYGAILAGDQEACEQFVSEVQCASERMLEHAPVLHSAKSLLRSINA